LKTPFWASNAKPQTGPDNGGNAVRILLALLVSFCGAETVKKFAGFRLTQIDHGSVYEQAGLRVGDIVRSLNGKAVVQPDDLKELPVILARDKKVEIKITRGAKKMTLRYRRVLQPRETASAKPSPQVK
jgi:S1-C subfamily serine protease